MIILWLFWEAKEICSFNIKYERKHHVSDYILLKSLFKSHIKNETSGEVGAYSNNLVQGESFDLLPFFVCHIMSLFL